MRVDIGDNVVQGEQIGLVGSSGWSTMPHLHFEVETPMGQIVDPYAGPYSQAETYWCDQQDPLPGFCTD